MKKILHLIAFLYFPFFVFSQNYSFDWVKAFNTNNTGINYLNTSLMTDNQSNIYYVSNFLDSIDIDPTNNHLYITKKYEEAYGSYIVKLDKDGNFKFGFALNFNHSIVKSIFVDKNNYIYVCGNYSTYKNNWNIFLNKYDSNGNSIWKKTFSNIRNNDAYSVVVDNYESIFLTGFLENENSLGSNSYHKDLIIKKLDSDGNQIWSATIGGNNDVIGNSIKLDNEGNVLVAGTFIGEVDFDPNSGKYLLTSDSLVSNGFVLKLDPLGSFVWAKKIGSGREVDISNLVIDKSNNIYIAGSFEKNIYLNDIHVKNITLYKDLFILKISEEDSKNWIKTFGGFYDEYRIDICLDYQSNIFCISGITNNFELETLNGKIKNANSSKLMLLKIRSNSTVEWGKLLDIEQGYRAYSKIITDIKNNIVISGSFTHSASFEFGTNLNTLTSLYNRRLKDYNNSDFILKLKPNTLAIEDQIEDNPDLKIFPNPTNNAIQITGNPSINNKNFTITNILGKTVKSGKIKSSDDIIDLSDFNSGVYYLKIEDYLNAFKIIKID